MKTNVYLHILVMAGVTYLIRLLPLTLITKQIRSRLIRSFLYYIPYVTLSVMTFPAILHETDSIWSAGAGFLTALLLAYQKKSLFFVSIAACVVVFVLEMLMPVFLT